MGLTWAELCRPQLAIAVFNWGWWHGAEFIDDLRTISSSGTRGTAGNTWTEGAAATGSWHRT